MWVLEAGAAEYRQLEGAVGEHVGTFGVGECYRRWVNAGGRYHRVHAGRKAAGVGVTWSS